MENTLGDSAKGTEKATPRAKVAAKFKVYAAKPEVKELYATMEVCAKGIDVANSIVNLLTNPKLIGALEKTAPALATNLKKASELAKVLGPAGIALGVGVDLLVAVGLLEDATMMKLDELSRQIEDLREDVKKGFESLKLHMKIAETLQRFLPIFDKMLANVLCYEQILADPGDTDGFFERIEDMMKGYSPSDIIVALRQVHVLIAGEGVFQSKPLFRQLAEEAYELEGEAFDRFLSTLLFQFQVMVGLEMRAVRMLRSFIALQEKDVTYASDVKTIFEHLALQRSKHDPFLQFEWYLKLMAFGGQMTMTTVKQPERHVYMTLLSFALNTYDVCGCKHHPGDPGVIIVTPHCDGGKFLLSTKKWPGRYWYVTFVEGNVEGWKGDPGPQGYWKFTIKNARTRTFVLTTCKWPEWHMYMYEGPFNRNVKTKKGNPAPLGQFILHDLTSPA